jgi:hypothetical protein
MTAFLIILYFSVKLLICAAVCDLKWDDVVIYKISYPKKQFGFWNN